MGKQNKQTRNEAEFKRSEQRFDFAVTGLTLRADENGKKRIRGHAAVFDSPSNSPLWWGDIYEVIGRTAFNKTLQEAKDIKALFNHDTALVLGSTKAGTLELKTDDTGLYFEIIPAENLRSYENDLMISIERGDISGCSFGFFPVKWHEEYREKEEIEVLVIDELRLFEVSVVAFPAYGETDVDFRGAQAEKKRRGEDTIEGEIEHSEDNTEGQSSHEEEPAEGHSEEGDQPADDAATEKRRSYWSNFLMIEKLK